MSDLALLTSDGLSPFDLVNMTKIIREGHGTWYHAELMRALHHLMPHADADNMRRLETAYPGSCAAYRIWYNSPSALAAVAS